MPPIWHHAQRPVEAHIFPFLVAALFFDRKDVGSYMASRWREPCARPALPPGRRPTRSLKYLKALIITNRILTAALPLCRTPRSQVSAD